MCPTLYSILNNNSILNNKTPKSLNSESLVKVQSFLTEHYDYNLVQGYSY